METPSISIVTSTRNHGHLISRAFHSILLQNVDYPAEIIVVDDGSTDDTPTICEYLGERAKDEGFDWKYIRTENGWYRNAGLAVNIGYRQAKGDIIICQSDEIVHGTPDAINALAILEEDQFNIATVYNVMPDGRIDRCYSGLDNQQETFFLGAIWRKHIYAIGGYDEEFVAPQFSDNWFWACLIRGLGLKPNWMGLDAMAFHQHHDRPRGLNRASQPSKELYERKMSEALNTGVYQSSGGPWPM